MPTGHEQSSPWWHCSECNGIEFEAIVVFEKGVWEDDDTYEEEYPATGIVNTVYTRRLTCAKCGHTFSPAVEFGWTAETERQN